jgi:hypothetical protein
MATTCIGCATCVSRLGQCNNCRLKKVSAEAFSTRQNSRCPGRTNSTAGL